jgi:hypothetical protein
VRSFVHGVDRENIDEQLEGLAESHRAYLDEMAATVLPRIPAAEYPRINEAAAAALASGVGPHRRVRVRPGPHPRPGR